VRTFYPNRYSRETQHSYALDILKQRTQDADLKKHAIDILTHAGSFEYTRKRLREYEQEARQEILRLGGNTGLIAYLDQLSVSDPAENAAAPK
jgi:geranylgeranyl pyrophosphate synthase